MDLKDVIIAGLLSTASHTGGHFNQANKLNIPIELRGLTEYFQPNNKTENDLVNGAGFRMQDEVGNIFKDSDIGKNINLANAIYKLGYIADVPRLWGLESKGDVKNLGRYGGIGILGSAISDIHQYLNPGTRQDVDFWQSKKGVPGLKYTFTW